MCKKSAPRRGQETQIPCHRFARMRSRERAPGLFRLVPSRLGTSSSRHVRTRRDFSGFVRRERRRRARTEDSCAAKRGEEERRARTEAEHLAQGIWSGRRDSNPTWGVRVHRSPPRNSLKTDQTGLGPQAKSGGFGGPDGPPVRKLGRLGRRDLPREARARRNSRKWGRDQAVHGMKTRARAESVQLVLP